MDAQGHVLVIGAAGIDYKGCPYEPLQLDTSNPGTVRHGLGGVARNIAENLARLEIKVQFVTALGEDPAAEIILENCRATGMSTDYVRRIPQASTGCYLSVMNIDGDLVAAVCDYEIVRYLDADYISTLEPAFAEAQMVVIDLNMTEPAIIRALDLAHQHHVPVVIDPTSPVRAGKLRPYLDKIYMLTPNAAEATSLCDLEIPAYDVDSAVKAAHQLVAMGTKIAIVTLGELGIAYAESSGTGHIPANKTTVVDSTGAGDALTSGVIFGLLNGVPLDDAMRLGMTAASITLQTEESVAPNLTPDLLYDSLVV